jgi:hypothetical protein
MVAAGWSDGEIAAQVGQYLRGWFDLLTMVAEGAQQTIGGLGPFTPREVAALAGLPFVGAESLILLGIGEESIPARGALRKVGEVFRAFEEGARP